MKSRDGKSQRRAEKKNEEEERKSQKKEDPGARKGRKVARHCVFPMICGFGGSKSSDGCGARWADERWKIARRCGAKHISKSKCTKQTTLGPLLEVEMSKKCTLLWREAHLEVKMYKTPQLRSTCRSCDVENVHAVVARSTFRSQNVQNTPAPNHFWKLRCRKKCKQLWREAHFGVKSGKKLRGSEHFWTFRCRFTFQAHGILHLVKSAQNVWWLCSISKNDGRRRTFEEDLPRWIFRGRRSARDMFIRDAMRSGRWFPERGCILEHQIFSFGKMILRDRCSTSYDLASLFRGKRNALDRWSGKIAKRNGMRPSALHSTFHFWRKSRRIASFLMLSTSKNEEVSQNCFVFDVVKFQYWGSLAELLRFWCCQVQKLRKSRRIASFYFQACR